MSSRGQAFLQSDLDFLHKLFQQAQQQRRLSLYEHEVYQLLQYFNLCQVPQHLFVPLAKVTEWDITQRVNSFINDRLVIKILHPQIAHKTEVAGVMFSSKSQVQQDVQHMLMQVSEHQARQIQAMNPSITYEQLEAQLKLFKEEVLGVLICQYIESPQRLANELMLGLRWTRDFGVIFHAGLGGVDVEKLSASFKPGISGTLGLPSVMSFAQWWAQFQHTLCYQALTGTLRSGQLLIGSDRLRQLLEGFWQFTVCYQKVAEQLPVGLADFEINPMVFSKQQAVALDGLLRLGPALGSAAVQSPRDLKCLLQPMSICLLGVSAKQVNMGRIILRQLLSGPFTDKQLAIVRPSSSIVSSETSAEKALETIDGVVCFSSIEQLPDTYDLTIVALPAKQVPETLLALKSFNKTKAVLLISGGLAERQQGQVLEQQIKDVLAEDKGDSTLALVGGNSLGIISQPGGYDTLFVPQHKLPRLADHPLGKHTAFLSQSGAFMITRMSQMEHATPRYVISTGNQLDIGIADLLLYLSNDSELDVLACYLEGFAELEGARLARVMRDVVERGQQVVVYKAGRSSKAAEAIAGHTAAIAGDWQVCCEILRHVGCHVATSFDQWTDLWMLSALLSRKNCGQGRVAMVSNAGFESVGMIDHGRWSQDSLQIAKLPNETIAALQEIYRQAGLTELQDVRNPMDLTPMADDRTHEAVMRVLRDDPAVDMVIYGCVPLSPVMKTLPPGQCEGQGFLQADSFVQRVIALWRLSDKPLVVVLDAGAMYDGIAQLFLQAGHPVFRSADRALDELSQWWRVRRHQLEMMEKQDQ